MVAFTEGPLVSLQSLLLGIAGLIVFILLLSKLAKKINLVDVSDQDRKDHIGAIPLVGGIGVYISIVYGTLVFGVNNFYIILIISLVPIMIAGIIDGFRGIDVRPVYRILAQMISCWIVIALTDLYIKDLGNIFGFGSINLGTLGIPFTIFSVVGICNAFNMLDGKDGLVGSVSIIIMSFLMIILFINGTFDQWPIILVSSIAVFLAFNLNLFGQRRKIFLGDHGSTGLGYLIAWSLIYLSEDTDHITPVSALWFVILPLSDALLTFYRRIKSSRSVFQADRLHFHHLLSDHGASDMTILFIFCVITFISSLIATLSIIFEISEYLMLYFYLTIFVSLGLLTSNEKKR